MRKTFLAVILMAVLAVFAGCSSDENLIKGQAGDLTWSFNPDTGVLNIEGNGKMDDYEKVEVNGSFSCTAPWADYSYDIKVINLPEGLTRIGDWAFSLCTKLTEINLPDSVTSIGDFAFNCTGLTEIDFPKGLTSIGKYAFGGCKSLTEINLPEGLTWIGEGAFSWCESLTEVTLPDSLTSIGDFVFGICHKLTAAHFKGNPPDVNIMINYPIFFSGTAPDFCIYYPADNPNWADALSGYFSDNWYGYPAKPE